MSTYSRRQALKLLAATPLLTTMPALAVEDPLHDALGPVLPTRALGATGEQVSMLGVGGAHVGRMPEAKAHAFIDQSIEMGARFFDTAEAYGRGRSERYFGDYLVPKHRDHVFLMTKSGARNEQAARRHLDESRQRMKVDVIDLWQVHTLEDENDVNRRFDNGVIDVFLEAREKKIVKYIGFTGHSSTAAHVLFLKRLKDMGVEFDASQMPINVVDTQYDSFITHVLPILVERNYGILAMKTLAAGRLLGKNKGWGQRPEPPTTLIPDRVSLAEALGFVWSQPVACLISGMESTEQLRQNIALARAYRALNEDSLARIESQSDGGGGFDMEFYKDGKE